MARSSTTFQPGCRPGPGRKKLSEIVSEAVSDDEWAALFRKAKKRALNCKDPKADKYFEILLERAFGKVPQTIDLNARIQQLAADLGLDPEELAAEARKVGIE